MQTRKLYNRQNQIPSMSAEQMQCEQRVLNKTIEQKINSPSVYWTKQQLNICRLNTEQNHLNKSLIERYTIEQFHYWTVLIWTLPRNQLNNVLIEQISIEQIWQWLGFIVVSINYGWIFKQMSGQNLQFFTLYAILD